MYTVRLGEIRFQIRGSAAKSFNFFFFGLKMILIDAGQSTSGSARPDSRSSIIIELVFGGILKLQPRGDSNIFRLEFVLDDEYENFLYYMLRPSTHILIVAQNLVKLFSDALTESRGKVKELELSLSEKAESELIAKAQALAELQVLYSAEIESGFELLSALEERVLDLNSKEADVKEQLHLVAQERKSFARQKAAKISSASTLSSEGGWPKRGPFNFCTKKYDAAIGEKIALQKVWLFERFLGLSAVSNIQLFSLSKTTVSDMAALNQVVNEKILFAQPRRTRKLRSLCVQKPQKSYNVNGFIYSNGHRAKVLMRLTFQKLQNVESVAATGKQGQCEGCAGGCALPGEPDAPGGGYCCCSGMFGSVLISSLYQEISALADIRDADKAEILVLEDALKTRNVEFRGAPQQERASKLAAMDMVNTSSADKAQMMALEDVGVESEDVELVELREQIKSNAMDLKTVGKPDTNIRLLTFQQALKARDAKLTGLQNEERATQVHRRQFGRKASLRRRIAQSSNRKIEIYTESDGCGQDVELMDLQNKNEQIKSTAKSLQKKLLAAETSRHEQVESCNPFSKADSAIKELKQVADEERRASEEKLNSALRANAMLQTAYLSLHKSHHQLVKERGAVEPSVNQAGTPAPAFPHAQSAAGSHSDRQVLRFPSCSLVPPLTLYAGTRMVDMKSNVWGLILLRFPLQSGLRSLNAEHAPGLSERALYNKFMARLPSPNRPIGFGALAPIHAVPQLDAFSHGLKTEWGTISRSGPSSHILTAFTALVFAPIQSNIGTRPEKRGHVLQHGQILQSNLDLFMNRGSFVYYAGIYTMHTSEASMLPVPIFLRMWKMPDCFPDGKMKVKCYGLQFLGFDMGVYKQLRLRYLASTNEGMKRKATADLHAGDGSAKMQRTVVASERRHIF
ncbi:hypothetical protein C8J57DRAFT_1251844 [Mycena rebaudengoi]|nr:hypothetical protein C8J57DRAFT_1251844 [Mycena rebaudengoi]